MAIRAHARGSDGGESWFGSHRTLRFGAWAFTAFVGVIAAAVSAYLDTGAPGVAVAASGKSGTVASSPGPKPFDAEIETQRLSDAVRLLAADRDRLLTRIGALERNLGDITGSVRTIAPLTPTPSPGPPDAPPVPAPTGPIATAPPAAPAVVAAAPTQPAPVLPPATPLPPVEVHGAPAIPNPTATAAPAAEPGPSGPIVAAPSAAPAVVATAPTQPKSVLPPLPVTPPPPAEVQSASPTPHPTAAAAPATEPGPTGSIATKTEFGIDLGGATTVGGLRAIWLSVKGHHEALLEGLRPVVNVREGHKGGSVELRLVAGPLGNVGVAARLCATLIAAGLMCQPTVFDGQRLALR